MSSPDFLTRNPEPLTPAVTPVPRTSPPPLAVHGDPSQPAPDQGAAFAEAAAGSAHAQVAWMRPTEMPTLVGRELLGRAVEVQTAFARRSWRAPVRITRAVRDRVGGQAPEPSAELDSRPGVDVPGGNVNDADGLDGLLDGPDSQEVHLP